MVQNLVATVSHYTTSVLTRVKDTHFIFVRKPEQCLSDFIYVKVMLYVSLGTTMSCVCLLKSQRFAFSVHLT